MTADEVAAELALAGARELLESALPLRLGYNGLDGFPRVVPVGFTWDGSRIGVTTASIAPKVAALQARPQVAGAIDVGDTPEDAKALLVRGVAHIEVVDAPDTIYGRVARIAIEPAWARFFDFGARRMPGFLMELMGED